jgi:hypothetical protein
MVNQLSVPQQKFAFDRHTSMWKKNVLCHSIGWVTVSFLKISKKCIVYYSIFDSFIFNQRTENRIIDQMSFSSTCIYPHALRILAENNREERQSFP